MYRWPCVLTLLAGCDLVLGLEEKPARPALPGESKTHDEDADGIADALDPCPHRAEYGDSEPDADEDGIGDACDPRPLAADQRFFISFEGGSSTLLKAYGSSAAEANSLVLGGEAGDAQLVFTGLQAGVVDIEANVEIVRIKSLGQDDYAELGLHSVYRAFEPTMRGDTCFYGSDVRTGQLPNFLEFNNDADSLSDLSLRFDGTIANRRGRYSHARTPDMIGCAFASGGETQSNAGPHEITPRDVLGSVAISTYQLQVRLYSLWVVTPRP
jgi:hypothetical protein